jgi:hypothetical protein
MQYISLLGSQVVYPIEIQDLLVQLLSGSSLRDP